MSRAKRWLGRYIAARVIQAKQARQGIERKRWQRAGKGRGMRN